MTRKEAILYLEHTGSDDFNLEEHQIQNRLNAIQFLLEENQELKKQLEEYQLQNIDLRADIMIQKMAFPNELIKDKTFYDLYNMPIYEGLLIQQKEFIKYLEDEIKINTPKARWKHYNEDGFNDYDVENGGYIENQPVNAILTKVLQKYKEIIGGNKDE